jgi:hypothetical protein
LDATASNGSNQGCQDQRSNIQDRFQRAEADFAALILGGLAAVGLGQPSPRFCRPRKMNVDPHAWLTQTLERIAQGWPISQIDQLMP